VLLRPVVFPCRVCHRRIGESETGRERKVGAECVLGKSESLSLVLLINDTKLLMPCV